MFGAYAGGGVYEGTLTGRHLDAHWSYGGSGRVVFDFSEDGRRFDARWGIGAADPWLAQTGTRLRAPEQQPPALDVSGDWSTEWTNAGVPQPTTIHFVQSGAVVFGTYGSQGRFAARSPGASSRRCGSTATEGRSPSPSAPTASRSMRCGALEPNREPGPKPANGSDLI